MLTFTVIATLTYVNVLVKHWTFIACKMHYTDFGGHVLHLQFSQLMVAMKLFKYSSYLNRYIVPCSSYVYSDSSHFQIILETFFHLLMKKNACKVYFTLPLGYCCYVHFHNFVPFNKSCYALSLPSNYVIYSFTSNPIISQVAQLWQLMAKYL